MSPLLAVHISDGILQPWWQLAGFALAGVLVVIGAWRLREEDVPATALLAAAFFIASSIHVDVGAGSAHLLLNGLVGVVLGRRAALAILVGLALQAVLLKHGGYGSLGVNVCVMTIPALVVGAAFRVLFRQRWTRSRGFSSSLVFVSAFVWVVSFAFTLALAMRGRPLDVPGALGVAGHPLTLAAAGLVAGLAVWLERRLENAPEFALGLLLGELAVLLTLLLYALVCVLYGEGDFLTIVLGLSLIHLPIAVIEGVVLGFTVGFLARVKPELLGLDAAPAEELSPAPVPGEQPCSRIPLA
jgi:cobalt/nickel transport system permease protein